MTQTTLSPLNNSERVYALDALRGSMMLLGIFFHAICTYCVIDLKEGWPLKAAENSFIFDILMAYIHAFRMPVFFITSGFFVALLTNKKGLSGMMNNRMKRLLLPFLAGVVLICPLVNIAFEYSRLAFIGENLPADKGTSILLTSFPFSAILHHLWFLYFLIFYVFATWLLGMLFQKPTLFSAKCSSVFQKMIQSFWLRFLFVSVVVFLFLYWMNDPFFVTSETWIPYLPSLLLCFFFFMLGWGIYKTDCLSSLKYRSLFQVSMGTLLVLVFAFTPWPSDEPWVLPVQQALSAIFSTLLILGFIALFQNYFNRFSRRLTYLMDASYWVYLIHLPIVIIIPGLLAGSSFSLFTKFLIVLVATTAICFISYQLFVRTSFIGMFLNGKVPKSESNKPPIQQPQLSN